MAKKKQTPFLKIESAQQGERLDVILARTYPQYSRSFLQKWVKEGGVTLAGQRISPNYRVTAGQLFEVTDFNARPEGLLARGASASLDPASAASSEPGPVILAEDEALLVIDKPAGLVVHPAPGHKGRTLMDWLRGHLGPQVAKIFTDPERLGLVHRLDKDTSGVLLIAKSVISQTAVSRQFRDRTIKKIYSAFIEGVPSAKRGEISAPIGRSKKNPSRMAVSNYGRPSETTFEVNETFKEASQVTLYPKTGRTHQIRVHLAAIGHPIVGDLAYGSKVSWKERFGVERSLLHAQRVELIHPTKEKLVTYEAPWPADFRAAQGALRNAFAAVALGLVLALSSRSYAADPAAPPKKPTSTTTATKRPASTGASAAAVSANTSAIKTLRKDLGDVQDSVQEIRHQIESIRTEIENLNVGPRFSGLEQAIAELNTKAVAGHTAVEESKTTVLELTRRVKNAQELLDQIRDQVDRLQREVIQRRTQMESVPDPLPPGSATEGRPSR
jgi:23S rRNA pseudouridine1911/1915/1917 synthase